MLGVLASGSREQSGSETARLETMQFTAKAFVAHWGFGLGNISVTNDLDTVKSNMHSMCQLEFGAIFFY